MFLRVGQVCIGRVHRCLLEVVGRYGCALITLEVLVYKFYTFPSKGLKHKRCIFGLHFICRSNLFFTT